jgi:hypothetical protein
MFGAGPNKVTFDHHLLLMVDVGIVQGVLEVFPESVA